MSITSLSAQKNSMPLQNHRVIPAAFLTILLSLLPFADSRAASIENTIAALADSAAAFQAVSQKSKPAVVYIYVKKATEDTSSEKNTSNEFFYEPLLKDFFAEQHDGKEHDAGNEHTTSGHGSGFIINTEGYILTNSHVVDQAREISVLLIDRREFKARIIGQDRKSDVALLKIEAEELPVIAMGDSSSLKVGEWAIAIGSPFEKVQTVTVGIISATGRSSVGISEYEDFIQTDAAINPGNSGGPLLNIAGQVIGINTAFLTQTGGYMGIGFAVPINMARVIAQQLQKNGRITRGWLGIRLKDVSPELQRSLHLTGDAASAALVDTIEENSPAAKSALRQEDLIVAMDAVGIAGAADLRNRIALSAPGSIVTLQFMRDGQRLSTSVALGAKEDQPATN